MWYSFILRDFTRRTSALLPFILIYDTKDFKDFDISGAGVKGLQGIWKQEA